MGSYIYVIGINIALYDIIVLIHTISVKINTGLFNHVLIIINLSGVPAFPKDF